VPKLPTPVNIPLKVRGIKGVISIIFITPPPAKEFVRRAGLSPSYLKRGILRNFLKRGIFGKIDESGCSGDKNRLFLWIFSFVI